jgi:hypothetical protein
MPSCPGQSRPIPSGAARKSGRDARGPAQEACGAGNLNTPGSDCDYSVDRPLRRLGGNQSTARRLGFKPRLADPWFCLWSGRPVYLPPAFFWWWLLYGVYVRQSSRHGPPSPHRPERYRPWSHSSSDLAGAGRQRQHLRPPGDTGRSPRCRPVRIGWQVPAVATCAAGSPPKLLFADELSFECAGDLWSEPDIEANDPILSTVKAKFTLTIL